MRTCNETLAWLRAKIKECDSSAEELIQERDNEEEANKYLAELHAYQQTIDFITERVDANDTANR